MPEKIIRTEYSEEMQKSYLDYSMSVITARAIPDARDGLKPVQRRVLYDMSELKLSSDKPHRKSARIVGDTMGKYHPHGDSSIYETLVVLTQAWKRGMPLVDGHGNFGSIEGDGAAAMRYTEAKLRKFTEEVYLRDLDKTVDFVSNYDETEKEPAVLPVRVPNLLINGAEGIAVGMSTSIPPHNLSEVCEACIAYIRNRFISTAELMELLPGPDFPTGGIISNKSDLEQIYESGTGKLRLRGKIEVELGRRKADKDRLIISEIPYTMIGVGINKFLQDVADLVESRKLPEIVDISNQSDKRGTRIVLELKKDADIERIKNILYKKTKLEDSFGVNMLAIAGGRPETLSLRGILSHYLEFQYQNAQKKYGILLEKEREKKEVQEGLMQACDCIDLIIAVLRGAKSLADAKACLTGGDTGKIRFKDSAFEEQAKLLCFTQRQAQAILEMRLYRLIGLEIEALLKEHKKTLKNIREYEKLLKSKKNMDAMLIADLEKIRDEYGFSRRTLIEDSPEASCEERELPDTEVVFVMDRFGYCKILDRAVYERNASGIGEEYRYIVPLMSSQKICFFTDQGLLHQVRAAKIPPGKLKDKGIPIDNLCKYEGSREEILLLDSADALFGQELIFLTRQGLIKRVLFEEFITNNMQVGAIRLGEGDALAALFKVRKEEEAEADIVLLTDRDYILRFGISEIALLKKTAKGEKAMRLSEEEKIAGAHLSSEGESFLWKDREIFVSRLKRSHRNDRGSKMKHR